MSDRMCQPQSVWVSLAHENAAISAAVRAGHKPYICNAVPRWPRHGGAVPWVSVGGFPQAQQPSTSGDPAIFRPTTHGLRDPHGRLERSVRISNSGSAADTPCTTDRSAGRGDLPAATKWSSKCIMPGVRLMATLTKSIWKLSAWDRLAFKCEVNTIATSRHQNRFYSVGKSAA